MSTSEAAGSQDDLRAQSQQSVLAAKRAESAASSKPAKSNGFFPLGYKAGFSQWWASVPAAAAEHTVLSYVPYLKQPPTHTQTGSAPPSPDEPNKIEDDSSHMATPVTTNTNTDPYGPRMWRSDLVQLSGKSRALNEFSVERIGEDVEQNLVMLHGYGAGLGFFYKNFEGLSRLKGWKLYALDMLGMGRSSRPPFRVHAKDPTGKITEAENWFIDALEEWRIKKQIDRFTLMGHSMGGYMAVAYALKYPGHLNKLILASPVGIPEDPYAVRADMPEPDSSALQNEFSQDEGDVVNKSNPKIVESDKVGDKNNLLQARTKAERDSDVGQAKDKNTPSAPRRPLPKWLVYLWDANISPFSIVRWAGPLGPRFVSGWTSRRFGHLPPEEAQALHDYSYSLFKQRGSGEYALAYILAPGAFARSPLIRRIGGVGRQLISPEGTSTSSVALAEKRREHGVPVVLMYGENDWMDIAGGYAAEQKLKEAKEVALQNATEQERKADTGSAKVVIIKRAGHHLYLEGYEQFNEVMLKEMQDVSRRDQQLAQ
ncbi:MAG: hypothetical protein M1819_005307 [Sarea resinae]|nr:MAG: hypothetical protein M1819_005307 [Sarea resinae]